MLFAVLMITLLGLILGGILGVASRLLAVKQDPLEEDLRALLPGSQCGQCGYVGCGPAAAALAKGEAPITLCPPGGRAVIEKLAKRLNVAVDLSDHEEQEPRFAHIREDLCIGCTRCIRECTSDSIMGASKLMHTVIVDACHGCNKCVPVCPTEAIAMVPFPKTIQNWHWPKPAPRIIPILEKKAA